MESTTKEEKTDTCASNLDFISSGLNEDEFDNSVHKAMGSDVDIKPDITEKLLLRTPLPPSITCSNSMQDDNFDNMSEGGIQSKQKLLTPKLEPVYDAEITDSMKDKDKRMGDFLIEREEQKFQLPPPTVEFGDSNNVSIPKTRCFPPDEVISSAQISDAMIKKSPLWEEKTAPSLNSIASVKNEEPDLSLQSYETRPSPKVNLFVDECETPHYVVDNDKDGYNRLLRRTAIVSKEKSAPLCWFGMSTRNNCPVNLRQCNDSDHLSDSALQSVRAEPSRLLKLKKEIPHPLIGMSVVDQLVLGCPKLENDIAETCTSGDCSLVPRSVSLASQPNDKDDDVAQKCISEEHHSGLHVGDNDGKVLKHIGFKTHNTGEGNDFFDSNLECNNKGDNKFMTKSVLKVRLRTNRKKKSSECNVCHKKFPKNSKLKIHMRTHTGERPFECNVCHKKLTYSNSFKLHMRTHTGERPFECNVCHKKYTDNSKLKMHMCTHTNTKLFECNMCDKKYTHDRGLKVHMRTHADEKPFECNYCCKKFITKYSLKMHMRTHTGERPFECNLCDKKYTNSRSLKKHMGTHTGERPFECNVCDKKYTENNKLKIHMRTHTGEKPFECNICDKKFCIKDNLNVHMRTHTDERPFECNDCCKKFHTRGNLKVHMRTHTGEKPFQCAECGKRFNSNGTLKIHLRTHTGGKPFECNVCGKKFTQTSSLKVHMRIHTGIRPFENS